MKDRIDAGERTAVRLGSGSAGRTGMHGRAPGGLDAAASYLGMSESSLRSALEGGKTLAQVAKDKGKSVDGLIAAMVADAKAELAAAVKAGRLTQAQSTRSRPTEGPHHRPGEQALPAPPASRRAGPGFGPPPGSSFELSAAAAA